MTLYGRERELRILLDFTDAVAGSAGRALALVGDPGIGKTALLDAVRTQATGLRVLWARAVESESMLSFGVLGVLFHALMPRCCELPRLKPHGSRRRLTSAPRNPLTCSVSRQPPSIC